MKLAICIIVGVLLSMMFLGVEAALLGVALGWLVGKVLEQAELTKQQDEKITLISNMLRNRQSEFSDQIEVSFESSKEHKDQALQESQTTNKNSEQILASENENLLQENFETSEPSSIEQINFSADYQTASQSTQPASHQLSELSSDEKDGAGIPSNEQQLPRRRVRPPRRAKQTLGFDWKSKAEEFLPDFLLKTSALTKVGIVILFFGVAFLLKYASETFTVSIEMRLLSVVLGSCILLAIAWWLRSTRSAFSVLLQAAAVGILYLVTFSAMKLYSVISPSVGFLLMFFVSLLAAILSVRQDAKSLAIFGILGGFLAPILASTGSGNHVLLFSYYAILNIGILLIVWFKAWRQLAVMGFAFTFLIFSYWAITRYSSDLLSSSLPFLLLFFVFYVAVVMINSLRKRWDYQSVLDGPLVYGTPVIAFFIQGFLVEHIDKGLAWSAIGFGVFYAVITKVWWKSLSERSVLLRESFLAIACVFFTIAIPLALDYDVSSLLWALEGCGALWLAIRQKRIWAAGLGLLAQLGAGVLWLHNSPASGDIIFLNSGYLSAMVIALVGFFAAVLLRKESGATWTKPYPVYHLSSAVCCWGFVWWFFSGIWQLESHLTASSYPSALVLFVTLSCFTLYQLSQRFFVLSENSESDNHLTTWPEIIWLCLLLLPFIALTGVFGYLSDGHPSQNFGWIVWPMAISCLYWFYLRKEFFIGNRSKLEKIWHCGTFFLAVYLLQTEFSWQFGWAGNVDVGPVWQTIAAGMAFFIALWVVLKSSIVGRFWKASLDILYQEYIAAVLVVLLLLNFVYCCWLEPDISPLPFIPLLNPLDVWQLAIIATVGFWWKQHPRQSLWVPNQNMGWMFLLGTIFLWMNIFLLRVIHVVAGVDFNETALFQSDLVQTCLSIFWAITGIVIFLLAKNFSHKQLWMLGVGLFAVVVLKLFLIDLANSGTIERIVSFIVVGLVLLGVGYIKPDDSVIDDDKPDNAKVDDIKEKDFGVNS